MPPDANLCTFSTDEHFGLVRDLFASYFPPEDRLLTEAYTNWLYRDNPFGPARIVTVQDGARWVAFLAMIPVALARETERVTAFYVVNVLVHPEYQGKYLFGRMITVAKTAAARDGAVLMGHPNDLAIKAWERARMHFQPELRPWLPLPIPFRSRVSAQTITTPSELQQCAAALEKIVTCSDVWRAAATPEYLAWRYLAHPTHRYKVQLLKVGELVVGIQISKPVRPGVGMLLDQFVLPPYESDGLARLPPLTLCFWPEFEAAASPAGVVKLPLKKRLPMFFTAPERAPSSAVSALGLSASDF